MESIKLATILSTLLLIILGCSSAQNADATIEGNILKGVVDPIDKNRKIGQVIFDVLSKNPDHVSQIYAETGENVTYGEMKDHSIRLAIWMKKIGVGPNDIVVESSRNNLASFLPFVATFFIDAIFSPWTTNVQIDRARLLMQQYTPKLMFVSEETADKLLEAATLENLNITIIVLGKHHSLQSFSEIINSQTKEDVENFTLVNKKTPQEAALILLTSGTTAFPKGVVYSSGSLVARALNYRSINTDLGLSDDGGNTYLCYNDLSWVSGLWCTLATIVQKDIRVINTVSDEQKHFATIEKYKVNVAETPFSLIQSIIKSESINKYNIQSLKIITINGLKFGREVIEGLQRKLPNVFIEYAYGSTEVGGAIAMRTSKYKEIEAVGFAAPNAEVKFVDLETNKTLGPYKNGEIHAKTISMMMGYYKNPEQTQKVLDNDGWYHTGDLGYYDKNGEIFIVDRLKNIIKYKNQTIALSVIQNALLTHPSVEKVAAVSISQGSDGELPVAFVKKVSGSEVTKEELLKLLSIIEKYKEVDIKIYFIDKFPETGSGKVSEHELKQLAEKLINST